MSLVWLAIGWALFLAVLSVFLLSKFVRETCLIQIAVYGSVVIAIGWLICVLVF